MFKKLKISPPLPVDGDLAGFKTTNVQKGDVVLSQFEMIPLNPDTVQELPPPDTFSLSASLESGININPITNHQIVSPSSDIIDSASNNIIEQINVENLVNNI